MEPKKSKNKQVERHSGLYTEIGLLVALLLIFSAFKWKASPFDYALPEPIEQEEEVFLPTATDEVIERPKPPEPKPEPIVQEVIKPSPIFKLVSNEVDVVFDSSLFDLTIDDITDDVLYGDGMLDSLEEPRSPIELTEQPSFPGGIEAYYRYLSKNTVYPELENRFGIGGTVTLKYEINKKGEVTNVEVAKGATTNLDNEALRVAKSIPKWNPGKQNGKPVSCWFYQRIVFKAP
ncbi:MAG: energy transducer TonB [Bacteroidia bacterium]